MLSAATTAFYIHRAKLDQSAAAYSTGSLMSMDTHLADRRSSQTWSVPSGSARPHARCELFNLGVKLVLVATFSITHSTDPGTQWALAALFGVCVSTMAAVSVWLQPYHDRRIAEMKAGFCSVQVVAALALGLTLMYNDADSAVGSMMFLLASPLVVMLTVFITSWRRQVVMHTPMDLILDQGELAVEMKLRLTLEHLRSLDQRIVRADQAGHKPEMGDGADVTRPDTTSRGFRPSNLHQRHLSRSLDGNTQFGTDGPMATDQAAMSFHDVKNSKAMQLQDMEILLQRACERYPTSSFLCVIYARFCWEHLLNEQRHNRLLTEAQHRSPALDVAFLLFCYQQDVDALYKSADMLQTGHHSTAPTRQAGAGNLSKRGPSDGSYEENISCGISGADIALYEEYQAHLTAATQAVEIATTQQHTFWTELLLAEPQVDVLLRSGTVSLRVNSAFNRRKGGSEV